MRNYNYGSNLVELNLAIIFMSTSGVLGRYIDLPVPFIIFSRALIGGLILLIYVKLKDLDFRIPREDRKSILLGGFLLGVHWMLYFYALKLSNVAIGMISLFTFPVITAILEPILLRERIQKIHLLLGLMVLFGIYLMVPEFSFENKHFFGLCLGLISALVYSFRNIMLRQKVRDYNQSVVMFNQLMVIALMLLPSCFFIKATVLMDYLPAVMLLALLTTAIGHTMFISSFKKFSITSASLISALQPVYGILLGLIFLKELPKLNTLIGGAMILFTVIFESVRLSQLDKTKRD